MNEDMAGSHSKYYHHCLHLVTEMFCIFACVCQTSCVSYCLRPFEALKCKCGLVKCVLFPETLGPDVLYY